MFSAFTGLSDYGVNLWNGKFVGLNLLGFGEENIGLEWKGIH